MAFHVGQKVVCVDDVSDNKYMPFGRVARTRDLHGLTAGAVYTIRDVFDIEGVRVCRLAEIKRPIEPVWQIEGAFALARFRPLTDRKSEVSFTVGADPESKTWDNRRKQKERV